MPTNIDINSGTDKVSIIAATSNISGSLEVEGLGILGNVCNIQSDFVSIGYLAAPTPNINTVYIGKEAGVLLTNGKRKKGIILSFENDELILEVEKKMKGSRKEYEIAEVVILKEEIKETKLKINFK